MAAEVTPVSFLCLKYGGSLEIWIQVLKRLLRITYSTLLLDDNEQGCFYYTPNQVIEPHGKTGVVASLLMIIGNPRPVNIALISRR